MFRLHHIHLLAPDPRRTAQWYVDMLDAAMIRASTGRGEGGSLLIMLGGALIKIGGGPTGRTLPPGNAGRYFGLEHFGLETNDIESVLSRAEARDVEVLRSLGLGNEGNNVSDTKADIKGPDELRIELQQPTIYWEPVADCGNTFSEMLRLHHLHIRAADAWKTARWWAGVFDGSIAGEFGDAQTDRIRVVLGGTMLNVSSPQPGHPTHPAYPGPHYGLDHFGLETDDVYGSLQRLRSKGVEATGSVTESPDGSKVVTVGGPDDVRVELVQPLAYG